MKVRSTPFGPVRTATYQARWGSLGTISAPTYHVQAAVIELRGSAAALAVAAKAFRQDVLGNGVLTKVTPLTTEVGDTATCHNPPTDDCTEAEVMAIVGGHYGVIVVYHGPATFVRADDPQDPAVDDANDLAQEDAIKQAVTAFANSITASL